MDKIEEFYQKFERFKYLDVFSDVLTDEEERELDTLKLELEELERIIGDD